MPRKRDDLLAAFVRKGFVRYEGSDHHQLIYHRASDGRQTTRRTKISRGSSHKDISDGNLANMARQVGLTNRQLLSLIDCPLSREDYEQTVGV